MLGALYPTSSERFLKDPEQELYAINDNPRNMLMAQVRKYLWCLLR